MNNQTYYLEQKAKATAIATRLKRFSRLFIIAEIALFALIIGSLAIAFMTTWTLLGSILAVISFIAYVFTRSFDNKNTRNIKQTEQLIAVYSHELEAISGDYSAFDSGQDFIDYQHPFTYDLDVFGQNSLFARLNRTVTTGGRVQLSRNLSFKDVRFQHEEIRYMSHEVNFMDRFQALGEGTKVDTLQLLSIRDSLTTASIPRWFSTRWSLIVASLTLCLLPLLIILSVFKLVDGNVPVFYATLQFFIVYLLCNSHARQIAKQTAAIHNAAENFLLLIKQAITLQQLPSSLQKEVEALRNAQQQATLLNSIINRLDRRGNILGLMLIDTFGLNDYFLIREYLRWEADFKNQIEAEVVALSHIDALVSWGRFAYNHPEATTAEVTSDTNVSVEAEEIYHPFLGTKAIKNNFSIVNGSYTIVTGANMAGKSTFLRTIGINYILARNGGPVFAKRMRTSTFNLFSSMRTTDDLDRGISYFNAELRRLQQLIRFCKHPFYTEGKPTESASTLIILDEILKGTNSLDKLNGSRLFLENICCLPVTGLIATHDLELSKLQDTNPQRFSNYCFEIELGTDVTYSYKITPGVARNQNATYLLKGVLKEINAENDKQ